MHKGAVKVDLAYKEIVDWGIIRRQWVGECDGYEVILEQHEEDRFTVLLRHKEKDISYYSYWSYNGSLTFSSLEEAAAFAQTTLQRIVGGDHTGCDGKDA